MILVNWWVFPVFRCVCYQNIWTYIFSPPCTSLFYVLQSQPLFELRCSNNVVHIHTCADSCAALVNLLQYLVSQGDLHPPPRHTSPTEIAGQRLPVRNLWYHHTRCALVLYIKMSCCLLIAVRNAGLCAALPSGWNRWDQPVWPGWCLNWHREELQRRSFRSRCCGFSYFST